MRTVPAYVWKTERTNVMTASAASLRVFRIEVTNAADWTGWVTRKNTTNAAPEIIRTFLTFTASYLVSYASAIVG
jgi:ABC-type taurine transport system substrate-binding protein